MFKNKHTCSWRSKCRIWALALLFLSSAISLRAQNFSSHYDASNISGECYELTASTTWENGSIWHNNLIDLQAPFDMTFSAYFGNVNGGGADGIVFMLQRDANGVNAIGQPGGFIAQDGISPSFAVEFDTYQNSGFTTDPPQDHVDVFSNGNMATSLIGGAVTLPNIEDSVCHRLRFTWDPSANIFNAYIDDLSNPIASLSINLTTQIFSGNSSNIRFGFTSATGLSINRHMIAPLILEIASQTMNVCDGPLALSVEGSGNYTWGSSPGLAGTLSCTSCASPVASPTTSGYYTVTANPSCSNPELAGCSYTDTIFVLDSSCCNSCSDFINTAMWPSPEHYELIESTGFGEGNTCCYRVDLFNPQLVAPPKFLCSYYGFRAYIDGMPSQVLVDYFDQGTDLFELWGANYNNFDHSVFDFCLGQDDFLGGPVTVRYEFLDEDSNVICDSITQTLEPCFSPYCNCDMLFNLPAEDMPIIAYSDLADSGSCCFELNPFLDWDVIGCDFFGWNVKTNDSEDSTLFSLFDSTVSQLGNYSFDTASATFCIPRSEFASGDIDIIVEYLDQQGEVICRAHEQTLKCSDCTCQDISGSFTMMPVWVPSDGPAGSCCWDLMIENSDSCSMLLPSVTVNHNGSSMLGMTGFGILPAGDWAYSTTNPMSEAQFDQVAGDTLISPGTSRLIATLCLPEGDTSGHSLWVSLGYDTDGNGYPNCGSTHPSVDFGCPAPDPDTSGCCDTICDDLITNGGFEDPFGEPTGGAPGFETDYEYNDSLTFNSEGDIAIANDPNAINPGWNGSPFSGSKMLIVDGRTDSVKAFWRQTIPVMPNTDYCLTFWVLNIVNNPNEPDIKVKIGGTTVTLNSSVNSSDSTVSPEYGDGWVKVCAKWNSGPNGVVTLEMINQSLVFAGNDFAIDNISFGRDCTQKRGGDSHEQLAEANGIEVIGNVPNPFNGSTQFRYFLRENSHVKISIFSLAGQRLVVVGDREQAAGQQFMDFDARGWTSGVYIYTIEVENTMGLQRVTKRMIITE